jgi:hypothetical protein
VVADAGPGQLRRGEPHPLPAGTLLRRQPASDRASCADPLPTLWLKLGIFITLIYSIYANLATDYGAMSAAEAAFGEPQPPPIPLEPPPPLTPI